MSAPPPILFRTINVLVAKGDKAKEKSEQFYIAAGQHLKNLKDNFGLKGGQWEETLKVQCNISTGRASELMQIADGRKTLAQVRASKAEGVRQVRARQVSLRSEGIPDDLPNEELSDEHFFSAPAVTTAIETIRHKQEHRSGSLSEQRSSANTVIGAFVHCCGDPVLFNAVIEMVITGERRNDFEAVRSVVIDFYHALAKVGR
jgi:hypothetical protein